VKYSKALHRVIKREFERIAERKTLHILAIILPIFMFFLTSLIYKNALVRELPVEVFDADHSYLSQKITEMVESAPSMRIVKYATSIDDIKKDFLKGEIQAAVYLPKGLERDVKEGKGSSVVVYKNTANLIIGNLILKDATTIVRTTSAGVLLKKLCAQGYTESRAMNVINAIRIDTAPLYNPNYSYLSYLVPGLMGFTFQILIMIASVLVISSEFTHGTFGELLDTAEHKLSIILFGKAIPHFLIHFASVLLMLGIVFPIFNIKIYGSVLVLILFFILFISACLMFGLMISSFFHDQLFATEIAVFLNTPAFIFSGFTFPLWAMPDAHSWFAHILPFTHFLSGFLKIYQMNSPISALIPESIILMIFVVVSTGLTYMELHHQVKKYYSNNNIGGKPE
jgi:ABC-2 type transport system permease protein